MRRDTAILRNSLGSSTSLTTEYALEFTPNQVWNAGFIGHNVYHGNFWTASQTPGDCFWEAWACPYDGAEYVISAGFGGAHPVLLGFNGSSSGKLKMSGNIYDGSTNVSFASVDEVDENTWHHIAVGVDHTNNYIRCYLNGVLTGQTAFTGTRAAGSLSSDLGLYIGGSDHSNFAGKILRVRGFEGAIPFASSILPASFTPEMVFSSTKVVGTTEHKASFLTDYSRQVNILPDYSSGYNGGTHTGRRAIGNSGPTASSDSKLPQWVAANFTAPTFIDTPEAIPEGAILFDDFSRDNQTFTWKGAENSEYPWIGSARTGQAWVGFSGGAPAGQADVGILQGSAVGLGDFNTQTAWADVEVADYTIALKRVGSGSVSAVLRYVDSDNCIQLSLNSASCTYVRRAAASTTFVGGGVIADTNWTDVTITVSGTSISASIGADTFPLVENTLTTGTNVGFGVAGLGRVSRILVT